MHDKYIFGSFVYRVFNNSMREKKEKKAGELNVQPNDDCLELELSWAKRVCICVLAQRKQ